MARATKVTEKKEPTKRSLLAASPRSIALPDGMREQIVKKAYELWQARGHRDGIAHALRRIRGPLRA